MQIKYEIWLNDSERWFFWELFRLEKLYLSNDIKKSILPWFVRRILYRWRVGWLVYNCNPRIYEKMMEVNDAKKTQKSTHKSS